jgi:hypothetical protein
VRSSRLAGLARRLSIRKKGGGAGRRRHEARNASRDERLSNGP